MRILVTTDPFGKSDTTPRELLKKYEEKGFSVRYNEVKRKHTSVEIATLLSSYNPEIIIAGTEKYTSEMLDLDSNLKMISRVGIGLDGIPLEECVKRNIVVANTPDAPSNAVADLTIGYMINSLRKINYMDNLLKKERWERYIGKEISECNIGIIGYGRIGKKVVQRLRGFEPKNIFINDVNHNQLNGLNPVEISSLDKILKKSDIITLHIPYNERNANFIGKEELNKMKKDALLINTSRGGVVGEKDLTTWLDKNPLAKAAIDTFEEEPYTGILRLYEQTCLTPHAGSCTKRSRYLMEVGAVKNMEEFLKGKRNFLE